MTLLDAVTEQIAAADHIPTHAARDLVDTTSPLACAELLHRLANEARQSVHTGTGQHRVVRADYLLAIAAELEVQGNAHLAQVVDAALHRTQPTEAEELRAQRDAIVDELVRRRLDREYIGEHPLTPARRAEIEADVRATWALIATGGAR